MGGRAGPARWWLDRALWAPQAYRVVPRRRWQLVSRPISNERRDTSRFACGDPCHGATTVSVDGQPGSVRRSSWTTTASSSVAANRSHAAASMLRIASESFLMFAPNISSPPRSKGCRWRRPRAGHDAAGATTARSPRPPKIRGESASFRDAAPRAAPRCLASRWRARPGVG
jgi:hypothetical protein